MLWYFMSVQQNSNYTVFLNSIPEFVDGMDTETCISAVKFMIAA